MLVPEEVGAGEGGVVEGPGGGEGEGRHQDTVSLGIL